jgi:hypothetical protein
VGRLEHDAAETRESRKQIMDLGKDLQGLASGTRAMIKQAREIADEIEQRQQYVSKLHDLFKGILSEAKEIIQRMSRTSGQTERVEQQVKQAHHELMTQSQRTGRLTAVLRRVLHHAEQSFVNVAAGRVEQEGEAQTSGILQRDEEDAARRRQAERLERMLTSSRESLLDVRDLISEANGVFPGPEPQPDSPDSSAGADASASRLLDQVQSLLELIEAERISEPSASGQAAQDHVAV